MLSAGALSSGSGMLFERAPFESQRVFCEAYVLLSSFAMSASGPGAGSTWRRSAARRTAQDDDPSRQSGEDSVQRGVSTTVPAAASARSFAIPEGGICGGVRDVWTDADGNLLVRSKRC